MDNMTLAYLAGAMDSDGFFTIKKSTYAQRIRKDAHNAVYSERLGIKQVTPDIPGLMLDLFGGYMGKTKPQTDNSKPLFSYQATDKIAAEICGYLLPYLRIKKRQVEALLELRESKTPKYEQLSYWFELEYPGWRNLELITTKQAADMLGYSDASVAQAIRLGTIIALPGVKGQVTCRIPKMLIEQLVNIRRHTKKYPRPAQLIAWRESLYQIVRELNKIGINGTDPYHRRNHHQRKD